MNKNFYYTILGVNPDAAKEEIEQQYKQLIHKYHPDSGAQNAEMFKLLTEARETLTDENKRRQYDESQKEPQSSYDPGSNGDRNEYKYDTDPTPEPTTSEPTSGHSVTVPVLLIIQMIALIIESVIFIKPDFGNLYASCFPFLGFMVINAIVIGLFLGTGSIKQTIGAFVGLVVGILGTILILGIIFSLLHLDIKTETTATTIIIMFIPFVIFASSFVKSLLCVKNIKSMKALQKLTTITGFLCSVVFLFIIAINVPFLYNYVYQSNEAGSNAVAKSEEREKFLSDIEFRDSPTAMSMSEPMSEGGPTAINTVLKSRGSFDVVKDHARTEAEGVIWLYPFEYLTKEEAYDFYSFVTGKTYQLEADKEIYDYCVIRFIYLNQVDNSEEYETISVKRTDIKTYISPQDDKYAQGYYIGGKAVAAESESKMFDNQDGYILLKVPKDYYDYNLKISFSGTDFIIDVNEYFK